jgi:transcriptional regulator with XRE-family HTH domain
MSTVNATSDNSITTGARIRQERRRLGLTQDDFAKKVGVHRRTQVNYESGIRGPDSAYLEAASRIGVNVGYVLTGEQADDWHQALVHLVDVMLDLLCLTKQEDEFRAAWKTAHDENRDFWHLGKDQDKSRRDILELLRKSPVMLEATPLADVIERLEFVLDTRSIVLTPHAKADTILRLYRETKTQGKPIDLQTVAAVVEASL